MGGLFEELGEAASMVVWTGLVFLGLGLLYVGDGSWPLAVLAGLAGALWAGWVFMLGLFSVVAAVEFVLAMWRTRRDGFPPVWRMVVDDVVAAVRRR